MSCRVCAFTFSFLFGGAGQKISPRVGFVRTTFEREREHTGMGWKGGHRWGLHGWMDGLDGRFSFVGLASSLLLLASEDRD